MGDTQDLDRRMFLRAAAVTAGAVAIGGAGALLTGEADAKKRRRCRGPGTDTGLTWSGRNSLYIPPVVDLGSGAPYTLTAATATVPIGGGATAGAWTYNGRIPGPTLFARQGQTVRLDVPNQLAQGHIVHWHGMVVDHPNDGHPVQEVAPGGTYSYNFPIIQRAALNFYHPHSHMHTGEQVAMGMAGGFLIRDTEEEAVGLPSGSHEVPLVIRDASLDAAGNMKFSSASKGFFGTFGMVNGIRDAFLRVDKGLYRFRIVAGTNARVLQLRLSDGTPFSLIGNDGGLLAAPAQVSEITMSPGERVDVLVDFRGRALGSQLMLQDVPTGWNLVGFLVAYTCANSANAPTTLPAIETLANPVRTRTFTLDGMTAINGLSYDINRIDFQVPFGEVERWVFSTGGNGPHPVHIHGASFQVISRTGGRAQTYPWESGWKDTVLLEDGETVEILIRFDGYRGLYLIHCHQLGHEDGGMMQNFEVV